MRARNATCAVVAVSMGVLAIVAAASCRAPVGPPPTTRDGAVAADDAVATAVGAQVLRERGTAADAAVATAFALGVVNPASSGIGGGGFALVWDADARALTAYDFREVAPAGLAPSAFVVDGELDPMLARRGGLAVAVPGEVAGLDAIHRAHGALPWRRVVTPAARLAGDGVAAGWFVADAARRVLPGLPDDPAFAPLRARIEPDGRALAVGDRLASAPLAALLRAIAADGPAAFYDGEVAARTAATVAAAGGVLTTADLAGYEVVRREPLWGTWRGLRVATMPLPSSGGLILLEVLALADALEARGLELAALGVGSAAALHVIAELLKHGFADRARLLGDDPAAAAHAARMRDPAALRALAATIDPDRVGVHERYGLGGAAPGPPRGDGGTSHLCVIDRDGNAVALTTTVNGLFGSKLVTPDGVVLNNEIDDFAVAPGVPNQFGLVQGELNAIVPGRRPLSSMTPVLLFDGDRVVGCAGGSGGPHIISNVVQVLLGIHVWGLDAGTAVSAPRIHHQWIPDELTREPELPGAVADGLARRGHVLAETTSPTAVQVLIVRRDGTIEAASDPRKAGGRAVPVTGR